MAAVKLESRIEQSTEARSVIENQHSTDVVSPPTHGVC